MRCKEQDEMKARALQKNMVTSISLTTGTSHALALSSGPRAEITAILYQKSTSLQMAHVKNT